ncbi:MAG: hypothetical protein AABX31_03905 [Nanoarchaeota archaeon]
MVSKKINYIKILCELIIGIISGTIFAIFGLLSGMLYGGNYGCFTFIDKLLGLQGYESCGLFATILGGLVGSLLSIFVLHRTSFQKESYEKIIVLSLILVIVIPLIIASVIRLPLESILLGLLRFLGYSFIPSLLITSLLNRKLFLKK